MNTLSVVVIAKNEEATIAQCLQSVLDAASHVGGAEIVMVDSASTDRTMAIAQHFGVRALSLPIGQEMSASAARFVGFHKTDGDLVMFVDGDTIIAPNWFRAALPYFDQTDVAGVMGYLSDYDAEGRELPYVGDHPNHVVSGRWLRGIGMYRRTTMDLASTFNPYLREEEEAELAFRLRRTSVQLLYVPHEMGKHLRGSEPMEYLWRKIRHGRIVPIGRTIRYALAAGVGWQLVFGRFRPTIAFLAGVWTTSIGCIFSLLGYRWIGMSTAAAVGIAFIAIAIKKGSVFGPALYVAQHCLILYGMVAGFVNTTVKDPREYPLAAVTDRF